jgi:hypothetical protein
MQVAEDRLVIPVDSEHSAIRLTVVFVFIVVWIISFFVISTIITNEGISLLAVLLGFPIAYGVTTLLERFLRRRWPSGRVVQVDKSGVKTLQRGAVQHEILSEDPATSLLWTFKINRRARVPKGWSMLACALQYENNSLAVYTFMSPTQLETFDMASQFKKLVSTRKGKNQEDMREDLRLAGEQRRLRDAENHRWMFGAEMSPPDFIAYLNRLKAQFPEWMPVN